MSQRILDSPRGGAAARATFDGFTLVLFCVPVMSGWFQYTLGPTVDILRVEEGISRQVASLLGTMSSLGGIIGAVVAVKLVESFGRRRVIIWGAIGCAAGICVLTIGSGMALALGGVLVVGVARILSMNSMISGISLHHGKHAGPVLTNAYALTSATGILAPLVLSFFLAVGFGWRPGFYIILLLVIVVVVGMWLQPQSKILDVVTPHLTVAPVRRLAKSPFGPSWRWLLVIMCATVAAEWATIFWSADLIRSQTHVAISVAALGTAGVLLGQFCGRIIFGWLAQWARPMTLIMVMIPISIVGWALLWLASGIVVALIGATVLGIGMSATYPFLVTLMIEHSHGQPDRSVALGGLASGLSSGIAPFVLASVSDQVGPFLGFLFVPLVLVVALAAAVALNRHLTRGGAAIRLPQATS